MFHGRFEFKIVVPPGGLEPPTVGLKDRTRTAAQSRSEPSPSRIRPWRQRSGPCGAVARRLGCCPQLLSAGGSGHSFWRGAPSLINLLLIGANLRESELRDRPLVDIKSRSPRNFTSSRTWAASSSTVSPSLNA